MCGLVPGGSGAAGNHDRSDGHDSLRGLCRLTRDSAHRLRAQLAAFFVWLFHFTLLYSTGALSAYGVDSFAHILLFYFIFMPVGAALSLDKLRRADFSRGSLQSACAQDSPAPPVHRLFRRGNRKSRRPSMVGRRSDLARDRDARLFPLRYLLARARAVRARSSPGAPYSSKHSTRFSCGRAGLAAFG